MFPRHTRFVEKSNSPLEDSNFPADRVETSAGLALGPLHTNQNKPIHNKQNLNCQAYLF